MRPHTPRPRVAAGVARQSSLSAQRQWTPRKGQNFPAFCRQWCRLHVNVISRLTSYKWFKIFRKGFITRQSHSPHLVAYYDKQARIGCFKNIFTVQKVFLLSIFYIYIFYSWNLKSHFQSVFKSIFLWSKRPINNLKMFLLTHTGTSDES